VTEVVRAPRGLRQRLRDTSLRLRLIVAAALAVVIALGAVLSVGLYEVKHELRHNVDTQLDQAASSAAQQIEASAAVTFGGQ
jgi:hypothetical protein